MSLLRGILLRAKAWVMLLLTYLLRNVADAVPPLVPCVEQGLGNSRLENRKFGTASGAAVNRPIRGLIIHQVVSSSGTTTRIPRFARKIHPLV